MDFGLHFLEILTDEQSSIAYLTAKSSVYFENIDSVLRMV